MGATLSGRSIGAFYRIRLNTLTSPLRFWITLSDDTGSTGNANFVSNTPAAKYVGFRFASATDTHYQAVWNVGGKPDRGGHRACSEYLRRELAGHPEHRQLTQFLYR
jgi:hypothetical protein